MLRFKIMA